jgi:hypothetical protein
MLQLGADAPRIAWNDDVRATLVAQGVPATVVAQLEAAFAAGRGGVDVTAQELRSLVERAHALLPGPSFSAQGLDANTLERWEAAFGPQGAQAIEGWVPTLLRGRFWRAAILVLVPLALLVSLGEESTELRGVWSLIVGMPLILFACVAAALIAIRPFPYSRLLATVLLVPPLVVAATGSHDAHASVPFAVFYYAGILLAALLYAHILSRPARHVPEG